LNELILELTEINPREFFGQQNSNIQTLKKYFPKLKIVARGNSIKAFGDEEVLEEFENRFELLLNHYSKYNKLDDNAIERILTTDDLSQLATSASSGDVLVHGVGGKLVKAQTVNQRKLVELTAKNDMVFAIGPAGTGKPIQELL
jgi:phosphate starvation-inducible PhoH-like protein